jgi:diadenosine tetraphosphate (Ap4A) HIT family hydrolase/5-methylcytosine-specific restriction endonuclease McrA
MQMSHIYQPVMLKTLLEHHGTASIRQIAQAFLARDESQIEYYEEITKVWPTRTLFKHGLVRRDGRTYHLTVNSSILTDDQTEELIKLCDQAISAYEEKRGEQIWAHRNIALGEISGSTRYDVLKRAGFRCDLCGVPADERALEVDHILPRKHAGTDDPENLQALCWKCNSNKRATDSTDFRQVRESYLRREKGCVFCEIETERVILENSLAYTVRDLFPATPLHSLIIPKRHVADFFELTGAENNAVIDLVKQAKSNIVSSDKSVSGFNIGVNNGPDAGQTVFHVHLHLIPRRQGDVERPLGGVRGIIPGKGSY